MADDMLIGVGVKADFSSLKTESRSASEALKVAKQNMAQALQEFGMAAEQGSAQAIAALKSYEAELAQAEAQSAMAGQMLGAAGTAAAHSVPQYAAASGALRTLEGNFSHNIRAAERFLTTTLGLGPVLQAAFPIVGAVAMAGVLFEMGKGLAHFSENASQLARETGTGWLDGAIGQMDGLKEATKQSDDEMEKLAREMDRLRKEGREEDIQRIRLTQGESAALKAQSQDQRDFAKSQSDLLVQQQIDRDRAQKQIEAAKVQHSSVTGGDVSMADGAAFMSPSQVAKTKELLHNLETSIETDRKRIENANKKASDLAIEAAKAQAEEEKHAAEESTKAYEKAARKRGEIAMAMVKENADAQKEAARATEEIQAFGIRGLKEEEEEQRKAAEVEKGHMEDSKRTFEERVRAEEKDAEAAAENAIAQTEAAAKIAEARIAYMLATGAISQQQAAHALAAIKAAEYTDQIKALNDELLALAAIQNEGGDTGDKQRQVGTKITSLTGDRDAALIQGSAKTAGEYTKLWEHALTAVGRQFQNVEDQMLRGQVSFSTGMKRMTAEVALDAVHWTQRWLQQHFMANAMKLASSVTTNAGTVASDASAAAASTAITRSTALHQAFIHAKLAAVKGFDWGTGWGGPIVGAIAAAAAFTGAMAWAMFEQGGVAQQTGPAYLHAGERVLTARQTATFDRAMSSGSTNTSSSSVTNHFGGNTFNGIADQKTFKAMLQKNNREVARSTQRAIRNGHFARGN